MNTKTSRKWTSLVLTSMLCFGLAATAQTTAISLESSISIEQCYEWTKQNYPLTKQLDLIDKTTQFSIDNASNGNLPQVSLNGQATYQSAVTELPIKIPNNEIPSISKDQYKIYGEFYQPLTNFTKVNDSKSIVDNSGEIEKQKLEIDLYKLKDRVNQLYFGTLLINEKIDQLKIIQTDLESALQKVQAAISNGTATLTDKQLLFVEIIIIQQQVDENKANQQAFLKMLSMLTGKNISENTTLVKPNFEAPINEISRPELQLFSLQNQTINLQKKQIENSLLPNLGLFGQAGYGRPALNFLSNDFDFYYLGGIKFNWNISSLYSYKNTIKSLDLASERISANEDAFLLNTNLAQSQQSAEIVKFESLILSDKKIVTIREEVLNTAKVQMDNGLITTLDYLKYLNDVSRAKQTLLLHETQLLLAQYNLKSTTGN